MLFVELRIRAASCIQSGGVGHSLLQLLKFDIFDSSAHVTVQIHLRCDHSSITGRLFMECDVGGSYEELMSGFRVWLQWGKSSGRFM
jgi:hypothetical protein